MLSATNKPFILSVIMLNVVVPNVKAPFRKQKGNVVNCFETEVARLVRHT
jgi:hypothetical protein